MLGSSQNPGQIHRKIRFLAAAPASRAAATQKRTGGVRRDWQTVVIEADGCAIRHGGRDFYLSENGVWLVERVPPRYLERL